jgi:hypothetical protein
VWSDGDNLRKRTRSSPSLGLLALCLACTACSDDGGGEESGAPSCVEIDYEGCAQLYPATYAQIWSQTLAPTCGSQGSACHPSGGSLTFDASDTTYTELIEGAHVIPGDPACSPLMIRLESEDPGKRMPPGTTPIPGGARCSIATWIAEGAPEN